MEFCKYLHLKPLPCSKNTIALFAAHLSSYLSLKTIKVYIAAVSHLHQTNGYKPPTVHNSALKLAFRGMKRRSIGKTNFIRRPITRHILKKLVKAICNLKHYSSHDKLMIKAAFTLAFAAFLRGSEFTTADTFQPTTSATIDDITVLDHISFKFHIKHSKTNQFHKGEVVKLIATGDSLCPVSAMYKYLRTCKAHKKAPLFHFKNGLPLSMKDLRHILRRLLHKLDYPSKQFNTHSFRIGAATSAAASGMSRKKIKRLGRWKSRAYLDYIRTCT